MIAAYARQACRFFRNWLRSRIVVRPVAVVSEADLLKLADVALENEQYEGMPDFIERPYTNYRFHNGFVRGFRVCEMRAVMK